MKRTVFLAALALSCAAAQAAEKPAVEGAAPGLWTMDLDAARKVAAEKKLPLLLNFTGSDWCGWCQLMDKQVFSQAAWQTYAKDAALLVWLDFPNDKSLVPEKYVARNKSLAELYGVQGFPSYIVLDDDGKTRLGQLGADQDSTPETFIAMLKEVLLERVAAVDAFLKAAPEKTAQDYRAAVRKRDAAKEELKTLDAANTKRAKELSQLIAEQDRYLKNVRTEARLAKLPAATADAYRAKKARYDALTAEVDAWIATQPQNNAENMNKFKAWKSELSALENAMRTLLPL